MHGVGAFKFPAPPAELASFIPKGVYRFMTLEDADHHWEECLDRAMARLARNRV